MCDVDRVASGSTGAPEDEDIDAELDAILTDAVIDAGGKALAGWCEDPDVAAYVAFKAMWRFRRTSQKKV